jgi:single-strand DNA-binding protein
MRDWKDEIMFNTLIFTVMANLRNSVQLIGRLGKDPEIRTFDSGKKQATFSIATSETYKNQKGEKVEETQWHNLVIWGKLADIAGQYLKKGSEVAVEGKLVHRSFDGKGGKKYITEIIVNEMLMLRGKQ